MQHWRKIGIIFPAVVLAVISSISLAEILPPESPAPNSAPRESEEAFRTRIQQRKQNRQEQSSAAETPAEKAAVAAAEAAAAAKKHPPPPPGPDRHHVSAQLSMPFIKTKGADYKDFAIDPSVFLQYRYLLNDKPSTDMAIWLGFAVLPISGTGTYKSTPASFGFLYFGPMVSIGKFFLQTSEEEDVPEKPSSGFKLSLGLTAQSRFVETERGQEPSGTEFEEKGAGYDPPGLWTDFNVFWKLDNNLSLDASLGSGMGKNKIYYYGAFGVGFWH
jgi:hypothetical protein